MSMTENKDNSEDEERPAKKRPALLSPLSSSFPVQWSKEEATRLSDGTITLKQHDLASCGQTTTYYIHNVVFLTGRHTSSDLVNENSHLNTLTVSLSEDEPEGFAVLLDFIYYANSVEDDQRVLAKLTTVQAMTVYHLADRFHAGSIQQTLVDHLLLHEFKAQPLFMFPTVLLDQSVVSLAEAAHIAPTVLVALPPTCRDNNRSMFRPSGHLRPLIALASMEGHTDTLSEEVFHAVWNLVYDNYP
jgi:hypothetical protein